MSKEPFEQEVEDYSKQPLSEFHRVYRVNGKLQINSIDCQGHGDVLRTLSYTKKLQEKLGERIYLRILVEKSIMKETIGILDEVNFTSDFPEPVLICVQEPLDFHQHSPIWLRHKRAQSVFEWLGYPDIDLRRSPRDKGHIAVWESSKNIRPSPRWKDPVHPEDILEFAGSLGKDVIPVHYRMPVSEVFEIISTSSFCIGYEGMGNVIAYNYRKPMIVFSESKIITRNTSGPWPYVTRKITPDLVDNIDRIIDEQRVKIYESEKTSQD